MTAALALSGADARAQDPVSEALREQSCRMLLAGTGGVPDQVRAEGGAEPPAAWPAAPAGRIGGRVLLRTATETFNRLYEFALRGGEIFARSRSGGAPWRRMPLPACIAGRLAGISVDDDELIALDTARRVYTLDNVLKDPLLWNWTSRWGTPFWTGPGFTLPGAVRAWAWSVVSSLEDGTWTDPAGNRTPVGAGKVSHIWGLRSGGRRLTFWDPWLAPDDSYEMCGPHRGRFRAAAMNAAGSYVLVVGRRGDVFTRMYDFDISGHDPVFFRYAYEDQRGKGDGAPIQLPAEPWTEQPKIRGTITDRVSIHKTGSGSIHRILRVEGARRKRTGYWERDVAAPRSEGWRFHVTGEQLQGRPLRNPRRDTSRRGLARGEDLRFTGPEGVLENFNVYCSPARLRRPDGTVLRLHHVDGLRQQARGRGLDDVPREQPGAIRHADGRFEPVTVFATRSEVRVEPLGWTFSR